VRTTALPVPFADAPVETGCSDEGGVEVATGAECVRPLECDEPDECGPPLEREPNPPECPPNPPPPMWPPPPCPPRCANADPGANAATARARRTAAKVFRGKVERLMAHLANRSRQSQLQRILQYLTLVGMPRLQRQACRSAIAALPKPSRANDSRHRECGGLPPLLSCPGFPGHADAALVVSAAEPKLARKPGGAKAPHSKGVAPASSWRFSGELPRRIHSWRGDGAREKRRQDGGATAADSAPSTGEPFLYTGARCFRSFIWGRCWCRRSG